MTTIRTTEQIMKELNKIAPIELRYSGHTGKFYLSWPYVEKKDGAFLHGIVVHRDTIQEAATDFWKEIVNRPLVVHAMSPGKRREVFVIMEQNHD